MTNDGQERILSDARRLHRAAADATEHTTDCETTTAAKTASRQDPRPVRAIECFCRYDRWRAASKWDSGVDNPLPGHARWCRQNFAGGHRAPRGNEQTDRGPRDPRSSETRFAARNPARRTQSGPVPLRGESRMNPTRYCGHGCPLHYGHFAALTADTGVRYPIRDHKRRSPCLPWRGRRPLAEQIASRKDPADKQPKGKTCENDILTTLPQSVTIITPQA